MLYGLREVLALIILAIMALALVIFYGMEGDDALVFFNQIQYPKSNVKSFKCNIR